MLDPGSNFPQPPRKLGEAGLSLWQALHTEYEVVDAAAIELLTLACESSDQAARLAEQVERDGEVTQTESGPKIHPAIKELRSARTFIVRCLRELGLSYEPIKPVGRPTAWRKQQEARSRADQ
jgi:phage terminase small subunit